VCFGNKVGDINNVSCGQYIAEELLTAIYPQGSGYHTSFNATSDYRIKTDVITLTDSLG
jgi:hypothetical protein